MIVKSGVAIDAGRPKNDTLIGSAFGSVTLTESVAAADTFVAPLAGACGTGTAGGGAAWGAGALPASSRSPLDQAAESSGASARTGGPDGGTTRASVNHTAGVLRRRGTSSFLQRPGDHLRP